MVFYGTLRRAPWEHVVGHASTTRHVVQFVTVVAARTRSYQRRYEDLERDYAAALCRLV